MSDINCKISGKILIYIKADLIYSDNNIYFTDDYLKKLNKITTGSNKITLKNVNVKTYGYDKVYIN